MIPAQLEHIASLFSEGIEQETLTFAERCRRRQALLREGYGAKARRFGAACLYAARPRRLSALARALDLMARDHAVAPLDSPRPSAALAFPDGLCGLARGLNPAGVLDGYSSGLTLYAPIGPAAWWSPSFRLIMRPGFLAPQVDRAFARLARIGACAMADGGFEETVALCARPDPSAHRLGFSPALMRVYFELYDSGLAHSLEVRSAEGRLVAGAFGLTIGRVFMTEACFGRRDLARAALILLDRQLAYQNFALHEARLGCTPAAPPRPDLAALGFEPMPREEFLSRLRVNLCGGGIARWRLLAPECSRAHEPGPFDAVDFEPGFASAA